MNKIKIGLTSYNCLGQVAYQVDNGGPTPLFYMVKSRGGWNVRDSLGRGYVSGGTIGNIFITGSSVESIQEAAPKLLQQVAAELGKKSARLVKMANFLAVQAKGPLLLDGIDEDRHL